KNFYMLVKQTQNLPLYILFGVLAESPLFGQDKITINEEIYRPSEFAIYKENGNRRFGRIRSIVSVNDELQIKIQRIYTYDELPNNFHCHSRMNTRESQLWLVDQYLEEGSIIAKSERRFIREWKSFKYPRQWLKLPNPISYLESFMMSDDLRLGMHSPHIVLEKYLKMEQKALIELRMDQQLGVDTPEVNSIFKN
ncbi:hypothetical protein RhiirC2_721635, partial [Rhizophagus irregularis]